MASANISHPFYPRHIPVPNYVENIYPTYLLIPVPLFCFALIFLGVWMLTKRDKFGRYLGSWEKAALSWWGLCGFIHITFEGFISLNSTTFVGKNDVFSQMCKIDDKNFLKSYGLTIYRSYACIPKRKSRGKIKTNKHRRL